MDNVSTSDLRKEFISKIKSERTYNIPDVTNAHHDPSYIDWLEEFFTREKDNVKELQMFKDKNTGLYCIDQDPETVTKEWIEKNSFRL
jgi:hypothetical protein